MFSAGRETRPAFDEDEPTLQNLLMHRYDLLNLPEIELPAGFELREYRKEDLTGLASLMAEAFEDESWSEEKLKSALVEAPDVPVTYVVESQGAIVASASVRLLPARFPHSGYVHWVASRKSQRGKRLGYFVTLAVLHEFVRRGCRDAVLETQDERLPAIKTYQNLGFKPVFLDESYKGRWERILSEIQKPTRTGT